jgi:hypothetical protein
LLQVARQDAQQQVTTAQRSRQQEIRRMWFNKSSSSGESEINTPVNVGGSAEFRDSVQERPVRHSRHNSFQMDKDDALGEM